jgi:hypothetical protein
VRRPKPLLRIGVTPEVVETWIAGDNQAICTALAIKPWCSWSPFDKPGPEPTSGQGTLADPVFERHEWERHTRVRTALLATYGPPGGQR